MSNNLRHWLEATGTTLRWVEPAAYATRAYAGEDALWLSRPQSAALILGRASAALKTQVVSLDIVPALMGGMPAADADDPVAAAEDALGAKPALDNARAVVRAVTGTLAARLDVVLRLPSPLALLEMFGASAEHPPSFDNLDDAAAALAGLVRELSGFDLAGLMLATPAGNGRAAEECESLESILGTARHHRWPTVLRLDGSVDPERMGDAGVDVLLRPNCSPAQLAADRSRPECRIGGGLGAAFWAGENFPGGTHGALYYGDAPGDVIPERILARLRDLG